MRLPTTTSLLLFLLLFSSCQSPTGRQQAPALTALHSSRSTASSLDYWLQKAAHARHGKDTGQLRVATAKVAELWRENPNSPTGNIQLRVVSSHRDYADPLFFDHYRFADTCNVKALTTRHTRPGIGVPLVGNKTYPGNHPFAQYQPDGGIERAVTALLTFPSPQQAVLTLYDPSKTTEVNGQPLTADYSAPLCNAIGDIRHLRRQGILGLLRTDDPELKAGFMLTQPYDPNKIPLILVHGLLSSQAAWRNVANDLIADPVIRKRYQIWFYHYPTGNPVLLSAEVFRRNLDELRRNLNPTGRDPAMRHSVVIAHSMGGLLSKTLITTTGDRIWKSSFNITRAELPFQGDKRRLIVDSFSWKARPDVKRIIYIAVPHRGSNLASSFAGRIAQRLIRLPANLITMTSELVTLDAGALTAEALEAIETLSLSSVHNLSPTDPMLRSLAELPVAPWVHQHSIIGNRGRRGPIEKSSDGVVSYTSSHIEGVDSELIVPGNHGAYKTPEAVAEIMRILHLP